MHPARQVGSPRRAGRRGRGSGSARFARIAEFLGDPPRRPTAVFVTCGDSGSPRFHDPLPVRLLDSLFEAGREPARSLWDRESLLADLDIEYVNFDDPAVAYLNPQRTFELQEPVERAVATLLGGYGIKPLHFLSGRGHHYVWRIGRGTLAFRLLAAYGRVPGSLQTRYSKPHSPSGDSLPQDMGAAYSGLGRVLEFLAHEIRRSASAAMAIPIRFGEIPVAPGPFGREIISLDITEYGDPLTVRVLRVPFGPNLKPNHLQHRAPDPRLASIMRLHAVPLDGIGWREAIDIRESLPALEELAAQQACTIPEHSGGMKKLIDAYAGSSLRQVHERFYSIEPHAPSDWPLTYDRLRLETLPPCARRPLEQPNDLLLQLSPFQRLCRVLVGDGWHPRHVAGLIRSRYERDYGWGDVWLHHDAAMRADFYARMFAGEIETGLDSLSDFNCPLAQASGTCPAPRCGFDLDSWRRRMIGGAHD